MSEQASSSAGEYDLQAKAAALVSSSILALTLAGEQRAGIADAAIDPNVEQSSEIIRSPQELVQANDTRSISMVNQLRYLVSKHSKDAYREKAMLNGHKVTRYVASHLIRDPFVPQTRYYERVVAYTRPHEKVPIIFGVVVGSPIRRFRENEKVRQLLLFSHDSAKKEYRLRVSGTDFNGKLTLDKGFTVTPHKVNGGTLKETSEYFQGVFARSRTILNFANKNLPRKG